MGTDHKTTIGKEDNKIALTCLREGGTEKSTVTWGQLRSRVGLYSQAMRAHGVKKGDRIAGIVSNSAEALIVLMATISVGAIHSSTATDMGTKGILDRMLQIEPTYVFMDDTAVWAGKTHDLRPKMTEIIEAMKGIRGFKGVVALPRFVDNPADVSMVPMW
jgi:acetoacetyl-CoA synthetase